MRQLNSFHSEGEKHTSVSFFIETNVGHEYIADS